MNLATIVVSVAILGSVALSFAILIALANKKLRVWEKDPRAGTFKELVMAAERCPVKIIHPGTPLNPKEEDLEKWIKRAERFN